MQLQPVNLMGGFAKDAALPWSAEDLVNYIPEMSPTQGSRTPSKYRGAPGLRPFVNIGNAPVRVGGLWNAEGKLFAVAGSTAYQISNDGIAIPLGTVPGVGPVSMSHNQVSGGNELLIGTGTPNGYVYNTSTQVFERITDPGYPGTGSSDYIDSYLIQSDASGRFIFWSDLADAKSYNTLDRAESEADPDLIVGLIVNNFEVIVFNKTTVEVFYDAGATTGTFQSKKIEIRRGCASRKSIVNLDNSPFWLGDDGIVYRMDGYAAKPVSSPQFSQAIAGKNWAQSFAFTYEDQGHKIYYITFPDGQTFGFDVTSPFPHRRQSYGLNRWRLNALVYWNGQWIGGDFQTGMLYVLDWDYMLEGSQPLVSERITGVLSNNQNSLGIPYAELEFDVGQQETIAYNAPPQPEGPSITGNAPDGLVNSPYASYAYTLSGGTPPYVVTKLSGSLPAPLTVTNAGVIPAANPTMVGTGTFKLRVTDANLLFDELDDTINITLGPMLALGQNASGDDRRLISSYGGIDWTAPIVPGLGAGLSSRLFGTAGSRFIFAAPGSLQSRYTDNFGVSFTLVDYAYIPNSPTGAVYVGGVALISANGGINRSTNRGVSWTGVGPAVNTRTMAGHPALVVALTDTTAPLFSTDLGVTWSTPGSRLDSYTPIALSFQRCAASDGETILFCGDDGTNPVIAKTTNGSAFSLIKLPSPNGRYITSVAGANKVFVVVCSDGTIYRSSDSGTNWAVVDSLGMVGTAVVHNGVRFIASGGLTGSTIIKTSETGAAPWVTRAQGLTYSILDMALSLA